MDFTLRIVFLFAAMAVSNNSLGAIIWSWEFNDPHVTVTPNETVVFRATLHNDIASETIKNLDLDPETGEPRIFWTVIYDDGSIVGYDDIMLAYDRLPGSAAAPFVSFFDQFAGVVIEPGESFEFTYYTLEPIGSAEIGKYAIALNYLTIIDSQPPPVGSYTTRITVVPLPGALVLFSTAALVLYSCRIKRKSAAINL